MRILSGLISLCTCVFVERDRVSRCSCGKIENEHHTYNIVTMHVQHTLKKLTKEFSCGVQVKQASSGHLCRDLASKHVQKATSSCKLHGKIDFVLTLKEFMNTNHILVSSSLVQSTHYRQFLRHSFVHICGHECRYRKCLESHDTSVLVHGGKYRTYVFERWYVRWILVTILVSDTRGI